VRNTSRRKYLRDLFGLYVAHVRQHVAHVGTCGEIAAVAEVMWRRAVILSHDDVVRLT
jgi:hypothetical protein